MKGELLTFIYLGTNLTYTSLDIWWVDYGVTIHISISIQLCFHFCKLLSVERYIYMAK